MAEPSKSASAKTGTDPEISVGKVLLFGPGLAFWFWVAFNVYRYGGPATPRIIQGAFDSWYRAPYANSPGVVATIFFALFQLVLAIWLAVSVVVSFPLAAGAIFTFVGIPYGIYKAAVLLPAWAKTSPIGAVVTGLIAVGVVYVVVKETGVVKALWRGLEFVVGSVALRRGTARRRSAMSTQRAQQTEVALRTSMETLQVQVQGLGLAIPTVPTSPTLWGGWIESVSARVQLERQTKVATAALECLKVVNDCYRQWKDYQLLRQDVEDIEETKKIRKQKREIELQELELKRTLEHQVQKGALQNKLKEQERDRERLETQAHSARVQRAAKPETQVERIIRLASEEVEEEIALDIRKKEMLTKHPEYREDIETIFDNRRMALRDKSRT